MHNSNPPIEYRVQALDQALLFLSSFAAFVIAFGFNLAFRPTLAQFLALLPLLVVVVLMSLYVGYMRGAVEQQSINERARGWVYLIFGVGWYSITLVEAPIAFGSNLLLRYLALPFITLGLIILLAFTRLFVRWFYRNLSVNSIQLRDKIGTFAVIGGVFLSSLFYEAVLAFQFGTTLNSQPLVYDWLTGNLVSIGQGLTFLFPLVILELKSHHCLDRAALNYDKLGPKIKPGRKPPQLLINFVQLLYCPFLLLVSGGGASRLLSGVAISYLLVLVGTVLATVLNWVGVLLVFAGDVAMFTSIYLHMRGIWQKARLGNF
jgi:hypothetical protein